MKQLLLLLSVTLLFVACGSDGPTPTPTPPTPPTPARRTVVVYMAAENNLSSDSRDNLNSMITGRRQVGDDENLVVFVDRADPQEKPFIARITKDATNPVDTLYKYSEDFYASDPDMFLDVLRRAVQLCPATEDYALVLWGHANGWAIEKNAFDAPAPSTARHRAYGIDSGSNLATMTGKWMNIPTLRKALEQMLPLKWKFIFCDCCNMQCAEVAYELRDVCDYLIASPAEITGSGAPYRTMLKDLFIHDDADMYTAICTDYHAQRTYYLNRGEEHLPISAVLTAKMSDLAQATHIVLPAIAAYLQTPDALDGLIYYYAYNKNLNEEKVMYDMTDVVRTALGGESSAYQQWKAVFDEAVLSPKKSSLWHGITILFNDFPVTDDWNERQGVLSMFFPMAKYALTPSHKYNDDIKQMAWYDVVGWADVGR